MKVPVSLAFLVGVGLAVACVLGRFKGPPPEPTEKPAPAANDPNTPEVVFSSAMTALKQKNDKAFIGCFSPEGQKDVAASLSLDALPYQWAAHTKPQPGHIHREILDVLDKYGLFFELTKNIRPIGREEREKARQELSGPINDPVGLFVDLAAAMAKNEARPRIEEVSSISEVKFDGDKAKGTATIKDRDPQTKITVDFVKAAGKWKIARLGDLEMPDPLLLPLLSDSP